MIRLNQTVGASHNSLEEDVWALKHGLGELGYYRPNPASGWHRYPDHEMIQAVQAFQKDEGLQVDGVVKPDGPTVTRLNATAERKRRREARRRQQEGDRRAAAEQAEREARIPSANELRDQAAQARTREEVARYLALRLQRGAPSHWPFDQIERDLDQNPAGAIRMFETFVRNPDVPSFIRRGGK